MERKGHPLTPSPSCVFLEVATRRYSSQFEDRSCSLEASPADPALHGDREWAIKFLIQAPDIHITLCADAMDFLHKKKHYKYASDLVAVETVEGGRFDIEHPQQSRLEQAKAMVEGALRAYETLVKNDPKAQFKEADEMLEKRNSGKLSDFLARSCSGDKK